MTFRAVFFDYGGVIQRTEFQAPRQHLAERFSMDYDDIDKLVFAGESARRASVGEIKEDAHWSQVLKRLKRPEAELQTIKDEFFGGDVVDHELVEFIGSLGERFHIGLISNAWDGMRPHLEKSGLIDLFETVVISAEVGTMKPEERIYRLALEKAQVKAKEAIFVDDMPVNIAACESIGMKGVLFKDSHVTMETLKKLLKE